MKESSLLVHLLITREMGEGTLARLASLTPSIPSRVIVIAWEMHLGFPSQPEH